MLRVTRFIRDALEGRPARPFPGVILIWNLTGACNLRCAHCYNAASSRLPGELSLGDIRRVIPQLKRAGVKVAVLSGGEPLVRQDIFDVAAALREHGISPCLSSNGLLINKTNVGRIRDCFDYAGVSIDGTPAVHDEFRGVRGSYQRALDALRLLVDAGVPAGLRTTLAPRTVDCVPFIFDLARREGIGKLYFSHLVPAGRGDSLGDLDRTRYRRVVDDIIDRAFALVESGDATDVVTGNNEADAVVLLREFQRRQPEKGDAMRARLRVWGGNQSGRRLVNIDALGNVRPDPFSQRIAGNVQTRPFDETWSKAPLFHELRRRPRLLSGKCGACPDIDLCNGGSRARALAATGDALSEDPACYL